MSFKLFVLFFLCLSCTILPAQTYTGGGGAIPDNGIGHSYFINVTALDSAVLNGNFGLKKICIDISHPRVADLVVNLAAPDGTVIELTSGAGGSGVDYTSTCFSMDASITIFSGNAPFTGTYYPRHNIGEMNDGQVGIGVWQLMIQDLVRGDSGLLNSWSLTFDTVAPIPRSSPSGPCNQFNAAGCACPDTTQSNCWLLPDMLIGDEWFRDTIHRHEFHDSITVSNSTANVGYGPMEIIGTGQWFCGDSAVAGSGQCPNSSYAKQLVKQRIYIKTSNGFFTFADTAVGTMSFHAELGHHHLHVDNWTENTLRIKGPEADPSQWRIVGRGYKNSMNLYDHVKCDSVFLACDYNHIVYERDKLRNGGLGLGYNSGSQNTQGISVGYADIYEYLLPYGQAIYFDSLCNGDYVLVAQYDPLHKFVDMRPENNINWFPVTLTQQNVGCCHTSFSIDTINYAQGSFRFIDRSVAMPSAWAWSFGDGDTSTQQFPYHSYSTAGYHTIVLHSATTQGCVGSDTFRLLVPQGVGIKDLQEESSSIAVFPNPTSGSFTLMIKGNTISPQITLLNLLGQVVGFANSIIAVNNNESRFHIETNYKGVLTLQVRDKNKVWNEKVVVE